MVVGMALDVEGRPICCEMWPGNTADVKTLIPVVKRMRERFRLREITVVADRGMVSQAHLQCRVCSEFWPYGLGKAPVDLIVFGNQPPAYGVALVMRSVGYILPEKTIVACNGLNSALARAVAPFGVS
jgi:hypothetical protein